MPVCIITLSECSPVLSNTQLSRIRDIVAQGLDSKSRSLDYSHIALRVIPGSRADMLGDMELEIFSQLYIRRLISRDRRAFFISKNVSEYIGVSCATWINMGFVGYSRVTPVGNVYFSDSSNPIIRYMQRVRGIATREKEV